MPRKYRSGVSLSACAVLALMVGQVAADDRTIDGSGNNPTFTDMGAVDTQLLRLSPPGYGDGLSTPAGSTRPGAREISNEIFNQSTSVPDERNLSNFVWAWGQFVDHDIDLTPGHTTTQSFDITVPTGDPHFDPLSTGTQTIPLDRSIYDTATGATTPRQQLNTITTWIDASNVYGSNTTRADELRTFSDGMLKTTSHATGDLLPFNTAGLDNAGGTSPSLFLAGDVRANENVVLSSLHTVFVREHNRLAGEIAVANPTWTDEQVYQRARKIVGAQLQTVTYNEFLPALGIKLDPYAGYDEFLDAGIANEFSTAAYRLGHSMLSSPILRLDESGQVIVDGNLLLQDAFFNPSLITGEGGIDPLLRGIAASIQQKIDAQVVDDVRNFLFGPPGAGGLDLVSLNIQRGRDHGLADYNAIRLAFGLSPAFSFSDITSDVDLANALAVLYGNDINNVDPWVGMLAEDQLADSSVGETVAAILADQFGALRDGDRFFYLNDSEFTADDLFELDQTTLANIILRNSGISWIQSNVFFYETRVPEPSTMLLSLSGAGLLMARRRRRVAG